MIHPILETAGVLLGISVTAALFVLNLVRLFRGRRIFRSSRSWRMR